MLDIKRIRTNADEVIAGLAKRGITGVVEKMKQIDEERRELIVKTETLKAKRNEVSKQIPVMKRAGENVDELLNEMKQVSDDVKAIDADLAVLDSELNTLLLSTPNLPHADVPVGDSEDDNIEQRKWGEPRKFDFEPQAHWDIGTNLGVLDFETAAKVTGARFTFYKGLGSRLERSLISFMIDTHTLEGEYEEVFPPFIVNRNSMQGTGQLPKFEEDAFSLSGTDYFLVPTAEVPVTNMYKDSIMTELPKKYTAYSACFRSEAGSAGRDTRGLIRQHQFNKVEMVKFVEPETSAEELESLVADAEKVLQKLGLPYRVVTLCTGDLGFSAAKTYDIEVWMPSYGKYVEISSCSNFMDFQARRANIKYRSEKGAKPQFVHTLNGSGLAVGRTTAAILENYQRAGGSVDVPEALREYMKVDRIG
ncbi:MAG: serine--tRNA ligase [Clostridia bacterium]|jgi:seryl-tRNA synthetase|nr:serine--tRNA ligase [Clostridia bacterium]MBT7123355.1 serine--tRNA ligase [Clostridia bacterium]